MIQVQPIGFVGHLEHHVGGVSGVLGEHLAMYLATDFQPANVQEFCTFGEPVTNTALEFAIYSYMSVKFI
jgi:hypothetical protein